jgi:hypothetical protein
VCTVNVLPSFPLSNFLVPWKLPWNNFYSPPSQLQLTLKYRQAILEVYKSTKSSRFCEGRAKCTLSPPRVLYLHSTYVHFLHSLYSTSVPSEIDSTSVLLVLTRCIRSVDHVLLECFSLTNCFTNTTMLRSVAIIIQIV